MGLFDSLFPQDATQAQLNRIERKLDRILKHFEVPEESSDAAIAEVERLARDPRNKIVAIKRYREITGVGLAEAKAAVEAMAR